MTARPGALALATFTKLGKYAGMENGAAWDAALLDIKALLARCEAAEDALANAEMGIRATSQALAAAEADAERLAGALADVLAGGGGTPARDVALAALAAHRAGRV